MTRSIARRAPLINAASVFCVGCGPELITPEIEIVEPKGYSTVAAGQVTVVVDEYFTMLSQGYTVLRQAADALLVSPAHADQPYGSFLDVSLDGSHVAYTPNTQYTIEAVGVGWHVVHVELLDGFGEGFHPPIDDSEVFLVE